MSQIVERLVQQLGPIGCLTDPGLVEPYLSDWRDLLKGKAICVTRPATVEELSSTVRICGEEASVWCRKAGIPTSLEQLHPIKAVGR